MNNLPSRWPGEVVSYDGPTRTCKVKIAGITDGSSDYPEAVIEYPVGDRAQAADPKDRTELRFLAGDLVWLCFECGDPRFPIITGHRTPRTGNPVDWRRWRHANIEMTAAGQFIINATEVIVNATQTTINSKTDIVGNTATTGTLKNNGTNVGSTHVHTEQGDGMDVSAPH